MREDREMMNERGGCGLGGGVLLGFVVLVDKD